MATATAHPARFLHKHRIEALTDGIYAVAMTILVLELKFDHGATFATAADFHSALLHLFPKFFAWIISFSILATFWISHHRAFHFVKTVDVKLLWINLWGLIFASFLPFASSMVGEHTRFFTAQAMYAVTMAGMALVAIVQITYLERHPELCNPPVPHYVANGARFRCFSIVAVAILAIVISAWQPLFGTAAFILMAVMGRIGRGIETRAAEREAQLSSDRPFP
jgi:uncharacterized membrane protein